ncbi:hypothetical protein OROHE_026207 [Orobanche hederae]
MGRRRKLSGGNERNILVRSVNRKKDKIQCENEVGNLSEEETYVREEFHIVDLKLNKIYSHCLPSLPRASGAGVMVASLETHSIFIFGGLYTFCKDWPLFKSVKNHPESHSQHFYMGASRLNFDPENLKDGLMVGGGGAWRSAPPMNIPHSYTCTSLNGSVYCFGNICFVPEVLHVDTTNGEDSVSWKPLGPFPPILVDSTPCPPVIPDPTKNRILVHFRGGQLSSPSLYAFYPPTRPNQDGLAGTWECLDSSFFDWNNVLVAALLDGVLYFHGRKYCNLVIAYEVSTRMWLDVQWSTRVIEKDFSVDDCYRFEFDSLFCLDDTNKILCFAIYSPIVSPLSVEDDDHSFPTSTTLLFFKFRAERCDSTIILTPLYTRSYEIESTTQVLNFLLL